MKIKSPPDLYLLSNVMVLLGLGVVVIYSSSAIYAFERFGSSTYFLSRQMMWIALGLMSGLFFTFYHHEKLRDWVKPALIVCVVLLIAVLFFGRTVGGARRWLRFGGIGFQPSEFVKLALILYTAYYCDRKRSKIEDFKRGLLPLLGMVGLFCGLIFLQPDLGTPVLIFMTCMTIALIGGAQLKHLGVMALGALPLIFIAGWASPYRRQRMLSFLDPWENAQGASYQLVQSLLALGYGGLTGTGLGASKSKLLYLPEPHTDFIFPVFGEEFGLLGSWLIIGLFAGLAWCGYKVAARAQNLFSSLVASGITLLVLYQAIINIAMVTGCVPTKGLPLPFISFGGSSLVVTLSAMGILLNISRNVQRT